MRTLRGFFCSYAPGRPELHPVKQTIIIGPFSAGSFGCQPLLCSKTKLVLLHRCQDTQFALNTVRIAAVDEVLDHVD